MKFARIVFLIAGVYGLLALVPLYFMENQTGRDYPPPITHPEYYYGFIGVGVAWQLVFLVVSRDPVRYRPAMLPGALEKIGFGAAGVALWLQGRADLQMLSFGCVDLAFAALFLLAFARTPGT